MSQAPFCTGRIASAVAGIPSASCSRRRNQPIPGHPLGGSCEGGSSDGATAQSLSSKDGSAHDGSSPAWYRQPSMIWMRSSRLPESCIGSWVGRMVASAAPPPAAMNANSRSVPVRSLILRTLTLGILLVSTSKVARDFAEVGLSRLTWWCMVCRLRERNRHGSSARSGG